MEVTSFITSVRSCALCLYVMFICVNIVFMWWFLRLPLLMKLPTRYKLINCLAFFSIWQLPVTRAKSPNLTRSRRKSCSDAVASPVEEKVKAPTKPVRHSIGTYKQDSPRIKTPFPNTKKVQGNGTPKSKEAPNTAPPKMEKPTSNNVTVEA